MGAYQHISSVPLILTGLPDEDGRVEIFQIHTAQMTKFKKMDTAVDLNELAKRTRNFTGAEIESVVRSAQATAMNRLIEVGSSVIMWHYISGSNKWDGRTTAEQGSPQLFQASMVVVEYFFSN